MIYFKTIRYKNFLSTGNSFTEIELNKNNTTLIVGENGAGKSTILDALSFAMYNKPFRKVNKPQLLNSINKKDLIVELEFDIGLSKYKIIRGLKPNIFEMYSNGKLLSQDAASRDYQDVLEKQILKLLVALAVEAEIYFLDEPFNHLDLKNSERLQAVLKKAVKCL